MAERTRVARTVVTVVMDLFVAVAVVLVVHLVVSFFGAASSASWGQSMLRLTRLLVIPAGIAPVPTPYGGQFDVNAAGTVLALLGLEWVLGLVRRNA